MALLGLRRPRVPANAILQHRILQLWADGAIDEEEMAILLLGMMDRPTH